MNACQGRSDLFDDPDRTNEARAVCKRECPRLIECRAWALHTDVAGVCGGMTEQERAQWRRSNHGGFDSWEGRLHDREALKRLPLFAPREVEAAG
jgi:hypothetical protein